MRIKPNLKIRNIAGENVVIMHDSATADMTKVINLNATSKFLWESFFGKDFEEKDLVQALLSQYKVEEQRAMEDIRKWIESLKKCGALE